MIGTLFEGGLIPSEEMMSLRYSISFLPTVHLSGLMRNLSRDKMKRGFEMSEVLIVVIEIHEYVVQVVSRERSNWAAFRRSTYGHMNWKTPNGIVIPVFGMSSSALGRIGKSPCGDGSPKKP